MLFFIASALFAPTRASAGVVRLRLDGDILGAAAVARSGDAKGQDLAVLMASGESHAHPLPRKVVWFKRQDAAGAAKLVVASSTPLDDAVVAYDVCRLEPAPGTDSLVVLRPDGLFKATGEPLIKAETLLAYRQEGELPRVRVCFTLNAGEPPVILLPVLRGLAIYRQLPGGLSLVATLPQLGELKVQGQPVRGEEALRTQRLALRLELAEANVIDFDGDGRKDICLAGDDEIACYLQTPAGSFSAAGAKRQVFDVLTADERKDTSLRTTCHLVELSGDGRADLVIRKSHYGVSDMESTLLVYRQRPDGRFAPTPEQSLQRSGFFAYQDFVDLDGDGKVDILAPVAELGWSELAGIALRKSATIRFVWYRNTGAGFDPQARELHELTWPVDFKNLGNIIGSLPLWGTHLTASGTREMAFFPDKKRVEVFRLGAGSDGLALTSLKSVEAEGGADALPIDLNGDGIDELVLTDPHAPERARSLIYVEMN